MASARFHSARLDSSGLARQSLTRETVWGAGAKADGNYVQRLFLRSSGLDRRARALRAQYQAVAEGRRESRRIARRVLPGAGRRAGRGLGGRARRRDPAPLPRARSVRSCGVLWRACRRVRARSRAGHDGHRQFRLRRRRGRRERNPLRLRAAPPRPVPAAQSRAGRHRGAGRDARRPVGADEPEPVARHRRSRFSPSVRFVVQSRLSGVAPHRLVLAGGAAREDHPLRGGARDRRLGRAQAAHRSGRPAMLRLLPPAAGRRAADLRRGRADPDPAGGDCAAAGGKARASGAEQGARGGVLFDLQLPAGSGRGQFRQLSDQAGGRGDPPRAAGDRDLHHPFAGSRISRLARDDRGPVDRAAQERGALRLRRRTIGRQRPASRRGCAPRSSRSPPTTS